MAFRMTGVVTNEAGAPVSNATVKVILDVYEETVANPLVLTNASGRYSINFSGIPGSHYYPGFDPAGTRDAVGFVHVEAPGFQHHTRWALATTEHLIENIRLHRRKLITTGESATLTIAPDDSIDGTDWWPGRELIVVGLSVSSSASGILTVEVVPMQTGNDLTFFTVSGVRAYHRGPVGQSSPASVPVAAGEYGVGISLPWGFDGTRSFVVKTSMQ